MWPKGLQKERQGEGKEKGLFTQICLMHLKYVVPQYLYFTSARTAKGATVNCFVENSAKLSTALLNHENPLCTLQEAA